jgi:hypothetical protein
MADKTIGEVLPDGEAVEVDGTTDEQQVGDAGSVVEGEGQPAEAIADDGAEHVEQLKLPAKVQEAVNARIGKITARAKSAEEKLMGITAERDELKQRVERVGDATVLQAAEQAGVLPELIDKADAAQIVEFRAAKANAEALESWLEDNPDPDATMTLNVGGTQRECKRSEVATFRRQWKAKLDQLGEDAPAKIREARQKTREVLTLGLAALKAGWKPGAKAATPAADKGAATLPQAPVRATVAVGAATPRKGVSAATTRGSDPNAISNVRDLAKAIADGTLT